MGSEGVSGRGLLGDILSLGTARNCPCAHGNQTPGPPCGLGLTSPILYLWLAGPHLKAGEPEWPSPSVAYLCLDPVEAPEPEDLAPAELPLGMVNLFFSFSQLLVSHLILPGTMSCFLQALELAGGDGGDDLDCRR